MLNSLVVPVNDWIFRKSKVFITKRINRNHCIVGKLAWSENRCDSLENRMTWIRNRRCPEFSHHNPVSGRIPFKRIRLNEPGLVGYSTIADSKSKQKNRLQLSRRNQYARRLTCGAMRNYQTND